MAKRKANSNSIQQFRCTGWQGNWYKDFNQFLFEINSLHFLLIRSYFCCLETITSCLRIKNVITVWFKLTKKMLKGEKNKIKADRVRKSHQTLSVELYRDKTTLWNSSVTNKERGWNSLSKWPILRGFYFHALEHSWILLHSEMNS